MERWVRRCSFVLLAGAALAAGGCAQLPNVEREDMERVVAPVEFEGPHGAVSPDRGAAIIDQLGRRAGETDVLDRHLAAEQAINLGAPLTLGNRVILLQDGPATYRSMQEAIRSAREHIDLETYTFEDDEVGRAFADLLLERRAAGIAVNLVYDSIGSIATPAAFFERLRAGGVQVLEFNPIDPTKRPKRDWLINNRDHRKLLIVDGRIAFVGGINISKVYSSSPFARRSTRSAVAPGWRDTHVRIEGPAAVEFERLFLATWARQGGAPLPERAARPDPAPRGGEMVRAISSVPGEPSNPIYLTLLSAIGHAERELHITVAYFAPDPQLLAALIDARKRGVDVALVVPSRTDSWPIFSLGRSYYTPLLKAGVSIHERRGAVMHSKTVTVDGVWSTVGSANLDWRSFLHNDEVNAVILGRDFALQMDGMFDSDLAESDAIDLAQWRERGWAERFKEWLARLGAYWL
jgi:cardiolipin synthase